jgi:RimJ/RimL family protein N-acetyltransferase
LHLRLVEERDLETVRGLRNRNRRWFFHDAEISSEQHAQWFAGLVGGPTRFYVIEEDGLVVGTISVTETGDGKEVGNLVLDDRYRGRGLMHRALAQLCAEPGTYFARVKPDNADSLRVFAKAGFAAEYVRLVRESGGPEP